MSQQKITTLIVDDEPLARSGLRLRLEKYDDVQVVAECQNGLDAVSMISQHRPDLVFLDIQMPGLNGFQVINTQTLSTAASVEILSNPMVVEGNTVLSYTTAGTMSDGVDITISYLNIKKEVTV